MCLSVACVVVGGVWPGFTPEGGRVGDQTRCRRCALTDETCTLPLRFADSSLIVPADGGKGCRHTADRKGGQRTCALKPDCPYKGGKPGWQARAGCSPRHCTASGVAPPGYSNALVLVFFFWSGTRRQPDGVPASGCRIAAFGSGLGRQPAGVPTAGCLRAAFGIPGLGGSGLVFLQPAACGQPSPPWAPPVGGAAGRREVRRLPRSATSRSPGWPERWEVIS